jgi:hypothetical protein
VVTNGKAEGGAASLSLFAFPRGGGENGASNDSCATASFPCDCATIHTRRTGSGGVPSVCTQPVGGVTVTVSAPATSNAINSLPARSIDPDPLWLACRFVTNDLLVLSIFYFLDGAPFQHDFGIRMHHSAAPDIKKCRHFPGHHA